MTHDFVPICRKTTAFLYCYAEAADCKHVVFQAGHSKGGRDVPQRLVGGPVGAAQRARRAAGLGGGARAAAVRDGGAALAAAAATGVSAGRAGDALGRLPAALARRRRALRAPAAAAGHRQGDAGAERGLGVPGDAREGAVPAGELPGVQAAARQRPGARALRRHDAAGPRRPPAAAPRRRLLRRKGRLPAAGRNEGPGRLGAGGHRRGAAAAGAEQLPQLRRDQAVRAALRLVALRLHERRPPQQSRCGDRRRRQLPAPRSHRRHHRQPPQASRLHGVSGNNCIQKTECGREWLWARNPLKSAGMQVAANICCILRSPTQLPTL